MIMPHKMLALADTQNVCLNEEMNEEWSLQSLKHVLEKSKKGTLASGRKERKKRKRAREKERREERKKKKGRKIPQAPTESLSSIFISLLPGQRET